MLIKRVRIQTTDGQIAEERENPRVSYTPEVGVRRLRVPHAAARGSP
jgi:hypothetical protein